MEYTVGKLMTANCISVKSTEKINSIMIDLSEKREIMLVYVVDDNDVLTGIITPRKLIKAVKIAAFGSTRDPSLEWGEVLSSMTKKYAADVADAPVSVTRDDKIEDVLNIMLDKNLYELPVVDKDRKLIGRINYRDIIACWARIKKTDGRSTIHEDEHWRSRLSYDS